MKTLTIIRMETGQSTFLAIGATEADAKNALSRQWNNWDRLHIRIAMTADELKKRYGFRIDTIADPQRFGGQCEEY